MPGSTQISWPLGMGRLSADKCARSGLSSSSAHTVVPKRWASSSSPCSSRVWYTGPRRMSRPRSTLCGCSVAVHACTCHRCGVDTSSPASAGMEATHACNTCAQHRGASCPKQHSSWPCLQHSPSSSALHVSSVFWTSGARHATRRGQGVRGHTLEASRLCVLAVTHSGSFDDQICSQLVRNLDHMCSA